MSDSNARRARPAARSERADTAERTRVSEARREPDHNSKIELAHDCIECEMRHPKFLCGTHHEHHPYPIKWSYWPSGMKRDG